MKINGMGKSFKAGAVKAAGSTWLYVPAVIGGIYTGIKKKSVSEGIHHVIGYVGSQVLLYGILESLDKGLNPTKKED